MTSRRLLWSSLRKMSEEDHFLRCCVPEPMSGCWLWVNRTDKVGYGKFQRNGTQRLAHRVSWGLFRGEIPEGMWILHRCDNPSCVNPDHLFLGTVQDNHDDMRAKGRGIFGTRHKLNKLTEDQVREIFNGTSSLPKTAALYGVHMALVWRIRKGIIWKHITRPVLARNDTPDPTESSD
jgi:hypothetical protein